jgi:hypothetical protein
MGAAVDEINRQRQIDRQDKADARADEALNLQKQTHAQVVASNGLRLAKAQQEQDEATAVREHLKSWQQGRQKILAGDMSPFAAEVENYNSNTGAYADGHQLVAENTPNGPVLNHVDSAGAVKRSYTPDQALTLFDAGMAKKFEFVSPHYFEQARKVAADAAEKARDRASREKIAGTYADARMYNTDVRADSAEEVAGIRADALRYSADHRPAAGSKGLTLAQQRANAEIQSARQALEGMDAEEIKHRTLKAMDSGRDNPDYDESLARAVRLAGRRLIGDDPTFDSRVAEHPDRARASVARAPNDLSDVAGLGAAPVASPQKQTPKQAAEAAMAANQNMQGYTLGEQTLKGFKVLDANGKHVGYWGR